jgi:hypothetical protein
MTPIAADNADPVPPDITRGLNQIHALYAEARIGRAEAVNRLAGFLDSKGVTDYALAALAAVKEWRR